MISLVDKRFCYIELGKLRALILTGVPHVGLSGESNKSCLRTQNMQAISGHPAYMGNKLLRMAD